MPRTWCTRPEAKGRRVRAGPCERTSTSDLERERPSQRDSEPAVWSQHDALPPQELVLQARSPRVSLAAPILPDEDEARASDLTQTERHHVLGLPRRAVGVGRVGARPRADEGAEDPPLPTIRPGGRDPRLASGAGRRVRLRRARRPAARLQAGGEGGRDRAGLDAPRPPPREHRHRALRGWRRGPDALRRVSSVKMVARYTHADHKRMLALLDGIPGHSRSTLPPAKATGEPA